VLEDGPAHMVAESPNAPFCSVDATAYRMKQMAKARDKVKVCAHARIVGVVFWDRPHNVTGRAPNAVELHPQLRQPAPLMHQGWPALSANLSPSGVTAPPAQSPRR
jgi:hypothetical protein